MTAAEAVCVADPDRSSAAVEGWLSPLVYDASVDGSSLIVPEAGDLPAGPVATVRLSRRVPVGLHGTWLARLWRRGRSGADGATGLWPMSPTRAKARETAARTVQPVA